MKVEGLTMVRFLVAASAVLDGVSGLLDEVFREWALLACCC